MKLKEAAEMLSVSESSIRRKIKSGEIRVNRAFRHVVIPVDELERFINKGVVNA